MQRQGVLVEEFSTARQAITDIRMMRRKLTRVTYPNVVSLNNVLNMRCNTCVSANTVLLHLLIE